MGNQPPFSLPPVDPSTAKVDATSLTPELLAGLLADGDDELAGWALRHALAESTRVSIYDGLVSDAMRLVGERWQSGQWSVAEEHLASRTLLRALERVAPELGPEGRVGPLAVLAGVTGEQHMIGLVCLEHVLAEDGWTVVNLGADLPAQDLGTFVARNEVTLVALSASGPERVGALLECVGAVRAAAGDRKVPVLVGGRISVQPDIGRRVGADGVAHSLAEAVSLAATHRPARTGTQAET